MVALLERECQLDAVGAGVYERECSRVWWGHEAQHGGYVVGLAMTALAREVGDDTKPLQHCTVQFLRPVLDGPCRIEVEVHRRGRTMANATARLWSRDRLCGLVLGSFGQRRAVAEFEAAVPPAVAPIADDEQPVSPWFHVPTFDKVRMYPRVREVDGQGPVRVGGWVAPRTPEIVDHRYLAFLADLWPPCAYHVWTGGALAQTVDFTYHARAGLPRSGLEPGTSLLVALSTRRSGGGFVDEDVEIFSPAGELLAQTRQMRYVHGPG